MGEDGTPAAPAEPASKAAPPDAAERQAPVLEPMGSSEELRGEIKRALAGYRIADILRAIADEMDRLG